MKKKILAMLCASLLISFSAVACDTSELPEILDCPGHVDTDNNGYCENCSIGVIKVTETTPATPEEYKEMVVNAIPTGGVVTDYLAISSDELNVIKTGLTATKLEGYSNLDGVKYFVNEIYKVNEENGKYFDSYEMYNTATGEKIYSFVTKEYEDRNTSNKEKVTIDTSNPYFFRVIEKVYDAVSSFDYNYSTYIYDYDGELIAKAEGEVDFTNRESYAGIYYVTFARKVYAFDMETGALLLKDQDANLLIKRPDFDLIVGKTGYIINSNTVYVYNITNWFETTLVYTIPSYLENAKMYVLSNGNILVQAYKNLADNAVNYDVLMSGDKYDVVQYVVNAATGEEKALEFGYIINDFASNLEMPLIKEDTNWLSISPIVNKAVDTTKELIVITDCELNILYCYQPTILGQTEMLQPLSSTRFLSKIVYGDGTSVKIIVDENGKLVKYLPNNAEVKTGYIKMGTEIYDFDLNLELNLSMYTLVREFENGAMLLSYQEEVESGVFETVYYYFDITNGLKVLLDENEVMYSTYFNYYVVEKTTIEINEEAPTEEEREVEVKSYLVYNINNELVATFDAPISNIETLAEGVYKVTLNDSTTYLLK